MLDEILKIGRKINNWYCLGSDAYRGNFKDIEITIVPCCCNTANKRDYEVSLANTFIKPPVQLGELNHIIDKGIDKLYQKAVTLYEDNLKNQRYKKQKKDCFIINWFGY